MDCGYDYKFVEIAPEHQIGLHTQAEWELSAVLCGSGERTLGRETAPFGPGDVVLVPPRFLHRWSFDPSSADTDGNIVNATLVFTTDWARGMSNIFPNLKSTIDRILELENAVVFSSPSSGRIAALMTTMSLLSSEEMAPRLIELLIMASESISFGTVTGTMPNLDPVAQKIKKVEVYAVCNFDRVITVGEMARLVGMNPSSFCSMFRRAKGVTFVTYLNQLRLRHAQHLLSSNPHEPISSVAYACGFQTVSHFNHLFSAAFSLSPSQWRSRQQTIGVAP
ncbi:MAG: AraC family transcriptional regulator [Bacteroidales bacterium]|nr:AraC family transcriptional regulator [Bacteroidales bacterium]